MRRNYNEDGKDTPFVDISYFSLAGKNEFFNALTKPVAVLKIGEEYYILLMSILLVSSIFNKRFSEQVGGRMLMIGRLEELKQLEKFYKSSKFEFLTLCFSVSQDLQNP